MNLLAKSLKSYNTKFERPLDEVWLEFDLDEQGQLTKEQSKKFLDEVQNLIGEERKNNYDKNDFD